MLIEIQFLMKCNLENVIIMLSFKYFLCDGKFFVCHLASNYYQYAVQFHDCLKGIKRANKLDELSLQLHFRFSNFNYILQWIISYQSLSFWWLSPHLHLDRRSGTAQHEPAAIIWSLCFRTTRTAPSCGSAIMVLEYQ